MTPPCDCPRTPCPWLASHCFSLTCTPFQRKSPCKLEVKPAAQERKDSCCQASQSAGMCGSAGSHYNPMSAAGRPPLTVAPVVCRGAIVVAQHALPGHALRQGCQGRQVKGERSSQLSRWGSAAHTGSWVLCTAHPASWCSASAHHKLDVGLPAQHGG